MVTEKWVRNMMQVRSVNERIMVVRVRVGKAILNLISVYAPQVGRCVEEKEEFYTVLGNLMLEIGEKEMVMLGGDLNG
jgi:hypothetical protein